MVASATGSTGSQDPKPGQPETKKVASPKAASEANGTPGSRYAQRFPKPRKTGVAFIDARSEADRLACIAVVERMVADSCLGPTLSSMVASIDSQESQAETNKANNPWPNTYCCLHKLSKEWVTEWLVNATKKEGSPLLLPVLNAVDAQGTQAIFKRFFHVIMCKSSDKLPRSMLNKLICSLALYIRQADVGCRAGLLAGAIASNGVVNWSLLTPYRMIFDENQGGKAVAVVHKASRTEVRIPAHVFIDNSYEIEDPLNDFGAMAVKLPAKYALHELFPLDGPPHTWMNDKKSTQISLAADKAQAQLQDVSRVMNENTHAGSAETLGAAVSARRAKTLEKARAAAQNQKANKKRKLTISLQEPVPLQQEDEKPKDDKKAQ